MVDFVPLSVMTGVFYFTTMIRIPVSIGELIDKITILRVKKVKITDAAKLKKVDYELHQLDDIFNKVNPSFTPEILECINKLLGINFQLWEVEDNLRIKERDHSFGYEFVTLARSVYMLNDERFRLKNQLNELFGSEISEVKEYVKYDQGKNEDTSNS